MASSCGTCDLLQDAVDHAQVSKQIMQRVFLVSTLSHALARVSRRLQGAGFRVLWLRVVEAALRKKYSVLSTVTSCVHYVMRASLHRMMQITYPTTCVLATPTSGSQEGLFNPLASLASAALMPTSKASLLPPASTGAATAEDRRGGWLTPPAKTLRHVRHCNSEPRRRQQQQQQKQQVKQTLFETKENVDCLNLEGNGRGSFNKKRPSVIQEAHVKGTMSFLLLQRLYLRTVHHWWLRLLFHVGVAS